MTPLEHFKAKAIEMWTMLWPPIVIGTLGLLAVVVSGQTQQFPIASGVLLYAGLTTHVIAVAWLVLRYLIASIADIWKEWGR